ncbi:uncharacterized protein LOC18029647 [Eutrema salsugineum]|uniref:uncharacterized protein LOC18029647 n=1 Tax=Eutrema salsugineum TaxID=72664 RepID=UPI000CED15AF|nr:uncharacterized protein LOC18029647 [Eutrema salsugineum]
MNAVEFPSHRHPLNLKELSSEETEESRVCGLCGETIKETNRVYECSQCDFAAHLDCAENPPSLVIERPKFHEHTLTLLPRQVSFTCNACGLSGDKSPYVCLECSFMTHKDCIDFPRAIRINRHHHRMFYTSFLGSGEQTCGICRRKMDGRYGAYSCLCCEDYYVHSRCAVRRDVWDGIDVEGKPEEEDGKDDLEEFTIIEERSLIVHFCHEQHVLSFRSQYEYADDVCSGCALPIAAENFYTCQECTYLLHERCANLPREITTFLHVHPLTLCPDDESSCGPNGPSRCGSCHLHFNGFSYRCLECKDDNIEFDIRCSSVSEPLLVSSHEHPLFIDDVPTDEIEEAKICSGCGLQGPKYILSCFQCRFHLCMACATKGDVWGGVEVMRNIEEEDNDENGEQSYSMISDGVVLHIGHKQHHLRLEDEYTDDVCSGCALPIAAKTFYRCHQECSFFLHERCANLPQEITTFLHVHPLTLCPDDERSCGPSRCGSCHLHFNGFSYRCLECKDDNIEFDIRCSSVSEPLLVSSHEHPLFIDDVPTDEIEEAKICSGCGLQGQKYILSCFGCRFHLCMACAALPDKAKYKYDEHLLSIKSGLEDSTGGYLLCDVCEKKIEEKGNYYKCFSCGPVLHTNCAVGSFRHMRPWMSFISLGHEYKVVRNDWTTQLRCSNCDNECHEPLLLVSTTTTDVTIYLCSSRCFTAYVPV